MSKARQIIESLREKKPLQEGTVIVLNNDGPDNGVQALLSQIAGQNAAPQPGPVETPSNDRMEFTAGGKRWKFRVNRNQEGQITDLDVQEM